LLSIRHSFVMDSLRMAAACRFLSAVVSPEDRVKHVTLG